MSCWGYSTDWYAYRMASPRYQRLSRGLKVISSVAGPMIPIERLRSQCRVTPTGGDSNAETSDDDEDLLGYLEAAIEHAEDFTGLSIALRTYELALDDYPWSSYRAIELPRGPLIAVESFYAAAGGSEDGFLDPGDAYILDDYRNPARLLPASTWPVMDSATNSIKIRFLAGYQNGVYADSDYAGAQTLPAVIRQALLLLTGHFFENRENSLDKTLATIPHGFNDLLRPRSIQLGFA